MTTNLGLQVKWRFRRLRPMARRPLVWQRHRGLRASDVVLDEYPKSGSTWVAFMLGEILFGRPIDFENQERFVPAVGQHRGARSPLPGEGRVLRSHEPYRPEYRRAIYLVRHVGDVAVSYYHNLKWFRVNPDFKEFLPIFLRGEADGLGTWANHVESWLNAHGAGVLVVRYEDLRVATEDTVRRMIEFLKLSTEPEPIRQAIAANTLERMRRKQDRARETIFRSRDPNTNFVRKGIVGESTQWLDDDDFELIEKHAGGALRRLGYEIRPTPVRPPRPP